jgi:hypothetical protein
MTTNAMTVDTATSISIRRRLPALIIAAAAVYALYAHCSGPVLPFDDAFITYRHAENLVHGRGFV